MAKNTRIKAKEKKGVTTVKALAKHAMLSYAEAKTKKKEANFITSMVAKVDGEVVFEVSTSQFLSKDPFIQFSFKGANKGKMLEFTWVDLKGNTQTDKEKIK
ncbi:MAG: thiosulfate oxidation carrier complex protein SoxZ [Arcobacteraceae bacterium]